MNGKALVKKTFRTLLAADTDDFNRGILLAMLEARVCPTEFPELGVKAEAAEKLERRGQYDGGRGQFGIHPRL